MSTKPKPAETRCGMTPRKEACVRPRRELLVKREHAPPGPAADAAVKRAYLIVLDAYARRLAEQEAQP